MKNIHLSGPWITDLEIEYVMDAMKNGWYENAYYYCETFQKEIAQYHGRKYALMTPNCTSAIHLLLTGLGIKDGDEVLVPECTWIASAVPTTYLRATPVFCDIDQDDWCISPESIKKNITKKTKAIICVGLYGNMAKMDEIAQIAKDHNLFLIEDAAESIGSTYKGKKSGSFGVGSVFSFHRTKTLTTGEGGMLLIDDEELYKRCVLYRDHGRSPTTPMYFNELLGYKYMPFNVQAAIGLAQFRRLDELIDKKIHILQRYKEHFLDMEGVDLNCEPAHIKNSAWITGLVWDNRYQINKAELIETLKNEVPIRPFFYPLTKIPAFNEYAKGKDWEKINPNAYRISHRGINLPSALNITDDQIDFVGENVRKILLKSKK